MRVTLTKTLFCLAAIAAAACSMSKAGDAREEDGQPAAQPSGRAGAASTPAVARLVFVDLQDCCDCTRDRIDKSWAALQGVLADVELETPVDRLHLDTQAEEVQPLRAKRPIMTIPALYFLSAQGEVLEQLQGELTAEQILKALGS